MKRPYADPDCPKCKGEGWLYAKSMITLPGEVGGRDCDCVLDHHCRVNMDRIWPSLSQVKEVPALRRKPPLLSLTSRDLWITAKEGTFRKHLKAVCYRKSHLWDAKVWSDKDIVKAWLNTAYAQGHKIYDTELDNVRVTAMYIDELVESYELVIFMLGVKEAANRETPSVLLEALKTRRHLGRPSWVVDQPQRPIMTPEHRAYSEALEGMLGHWPHLQLKGPSVTVLSGNTERSVHPVSDEDPMDLVEGASQINEALSDLGDDVEDVEDEDVEDEDVEDEDVEDEDVEDEDVEDEDPEDEDPEDEGPEDEDPEDEDPEDDTPPRRNYLQQLAENEEVQEESARKKRYKSKSKGRGR